VDFQEEGYLPLVDFETWRVAVLKYCEDVRLENITTMQRHMETDEVFVLISGNCTLISAGCGEQVQEIEIIKMEQHKIYNVKKGVWHNHVLDEQGAVLIVENQNTSDNNSPVIQLKSLEIQQMRDLINRQSMLE
jgi:hypothetical protein